MGSIGFSDVVLALIILGIVVAITKLTQLGDALGRGVERVARFLGRASRAGGEPRSGTPADGDSDGEAEDTGSKKSEPVEQDRG